MPCGTDRFEHRQVAARFINPHSAQKALKRGAAAVLVCLENGCSRQARLLNPFKNQTSQRFAQRSAFLVMGSEQSFAVGSGLDRIRLEAAV
jgi:hypothetical protein